MVSAAGSHHPGVSGRPAASAHGDQRGVYRLFDGQPAFPLDHHAARRGYQPGDAARESGAQRGYGAVHPRVLPQRRHAARRGGAEDLSGSLHYLWRGADVRQWGTSLYGGKQAQRRALLPIHENSSATGMPQRAQRRRRRAFRPGWGRPCRRSGRVFFARQDEVEQHRHDGGDDHRRFAEDHGDLLRELAERGGGLRDADAQRG